MEVLLALPFWQATLLIIVANYALYLSCAGTAYFVFDVLLAGKIAHRRYRPAATPPGQARREFLSAMLVMSVPSALSLLAMHVLVPLGWIDIYTRIDERGWGWYFASFVLMLAVHDTLNYWSHRTLHHPWLYKRLHREHHLSVYPTSWNSFSSGFTELAMNSVGIVIGLLLIPTHQSVLPIFMTFAVAFTVYGHTGYEVLDPRAHPRLAWLLAGGGHHAWHHRYVRGNYGMYTRFWDRLMRTDCGVLEPRLPLHGVGESTMQ